MSWHRFLPRFASAVWPTPCHDLTGSFWAPILAALRPGRTVAAGASYAPCERCGALVRGAHSCGAVRPADSQRQAAAPESSPPSAASALDNAGISALAALVLRAELLSLGVDSPPLPPEVVALARSFAGRALRACRTAEPAPQLSLDLSPVPSPPGEHVN